MTRAELDEIDERLFGDIGRRYRLLTDEQRWSECCRRLSEAEECVHRMEVLIIAISESNNRRFEAIDPDIKRHFSLPLAAAFTAKLKIGFCPTPDTM